MAVGARAQRDNKYLHDKTARVAGQCRSVTHDTTARIDGKRIRIHGHIEHVTVGDRMFHADVRARPRSRPRWATSGGRRVFVRCGVDPSLGHPLFDVFVFRPSNASVLNMIVFVACILQ